MTDPLNLPKTSQQPPSPSRRPNIVYILADDLGWNDVGFRNRENEDVVATPHIDRLAAEGVVLDNYYVQSTCTPSRSVLLTGKYQIHTAMQHSIVQSGHPHALGTEHPTLAEELKRAGYATHMVRTYGRRDRQLAFLMDHLPTPFPTPGRQMAPGLLPAPLPAPGARLRQLLWVFERGRVLLQSRRAL